MLYTLPMFRKRSRPDHTSRTLSILALLGLFSTGALGGQTAPTRETDVASMQTPPARVLLDGYINETLRANLALAQQTAAAKRADAQLREANGRFLPSVGLNARYSAYSGVLNIGDFINPAYDALNQLIGQQRFPTNINATLPFRQETKLELVQPIFNDALFGAAAAARAQRDLIGASRKAAMRQLAADVQQAWLGYASTVRVVETLEAMLPVLDENLRVSERLVSAGQATPDVVLRARAERSEMKQQISDAIRQRDAARRGFNLLRNSDSETSITLADDSTLVVMDTTSRATLIAYAMTHREELQLADDGIRIADAQRRIASAGLLPSVAVSASYGVQGDKYRFDSKNDVALANLVLSWNLFSGGQDAARREQATYARDEASYRRRDAERGIRTQVANAYEAVESSRAAVVSANDRQEAARRAFTLVERRYAEGLATPIDFLSARAAFTAAAINQIISRYTLASRTVELERAAALRALPQ